MNPSSQSNVTTELRRLLIEFDNRGEMSDESHLQAFTEVENTIQAIIDTQIQEAMKLNAAETYDGMGIREYKILLALHQEALGMLEYRIKKAEEKH